MSENCFVRQEATPEIVNNVTKFCSECYKVIVVHATIFYDTQNYRYLCESCKEGYQERLNENCEMTEHDAQSLFG